MQKVRTLALALVAGGAILASAAAPSFAKKKPDERGRFSAAPANTGAPALQTTVDMLTAGSDKTGFQATTLVGHLAGALTSGELASLDKQFGVDDVISFVKTFNFVVNDSIAKVTATKISLPKASAPVPDGKALSGELYALGVTPDKAFDVEYMLDALVTHRVHVEVMNDIDRNPALGPKADANYHAVLAQAMSDLKNAYKL